LKLFFAKVSNNSCFLTKGIQKSLGLCKIVFGWEVKQGADMEQEFIFYQQMFAEMLGQNPLINSTRNLDI